MNYSYLKCAFKCAVKQGSPHGLFVEQYQTDDDHLFHWRLSYISAEYEYGMVTSTIFIANADRLSGVAESKELALRAGRDRHRKFCPHPLSHRYDDIVNTYLDDV